MIQRFKDDDVGDVGGLSWFSHRRNSGRHTPGNAPRTSAVIIIVIITNIVIVIINAIIIIVSNFFCYHCHNVIIGSNCNAYSPWASFCNRWYQLTSGKHLAPLP